MLRGFWNGASPILHALEVSIIYTDELGGSDAEEDDYYRDYETNEQETKKNVEALAVMLDKRRRLGCCVGLKILPDGWMEYGSASATMQILRSVLGTLEALNFTDQKLDDASCARLVDVLENEEVLVPQIKRVGFYGAFGGLGGATRVFHAMGKTTAFKSVHRLAISEDKLTTEALHALMSTLKSDALPSLDILSLKSTPIASDDLAALLEGLEQSACANTLRELDLSKCDICAEGAKVLSLALDRNFLPLLEKLKLSSNKLGNDGVSFLTQSLQASSITKLTEVEVKYVGTDDVGRKSLAEAIKSGAFGNTRIWS